MGFDDLIYNNDRDDAEIEQEDANTNGSGNFLGTLHTKTHVVNVVAVVTNGNKSL